MRRRYKVLIGMGIGLALFVPMSLAVGAVSAPEALDGLVAYFDFLVDLAVELAKQGLEGYLEYLEALV